MSVWNPLWASELLWETGDISHMMLRLLRRGCVDIRMCRYVLCRYVLCRYVVCRYVDMWCCCSCSARHRLPQAAHLWTAFSNLCSVFVASTEHSDGRGEERLTAHCICLCPPQHSNVTGTFYWIPRNWFKAAPPSHQHSTGPGAKVKAESWSEYIAQCAAASAPDVLVNLT